MILKGDAVNQAYKMLTISGISLGPSNEDVSLGLTALEAMILSWERAGIYIGYIKSISYDDIDPNEDSGIKDTDYFAVYSNLACKLAPAFGKVAPPQLAADASKSYHDLFSEILINVQPRPNMPVGAGSRRGGRCYYQGGETVIDVQQDGSLDLEP